MNKDYAEKEMHYRLAEYTIFQMVSQGVLSDEEFEELRDRLIDIYHPTIGELERGMSCEIRKSLK